MLRPTKSLVRSFTGEVTVDHTRNFAFTLQNGIALVFNYHYKHSETENGDMLSFPELVAEFELDPETNEMGLSFGPIDDFLMLASLSARQRCVCLGWETYSSSATTKFYRREIAIPKIKKNHSFSDTLIDMQDFGDFIAIAYESFVKHKEKDLLRQAVYRSFDNENATFENNYLRLFSALETLVLLHRRKHDLEFIITPSEWSAFRGDMEQFVKRHPLFSEDKNKRKLIYDKLPELIRVSFPAAFDSFCESYKLDLTDLWPVADRENGISLSDIRNKLVHGDTFARMQQRALMSAGEHLRWIVERGLLSVLGWSYLKSKVSELFLARNMAMYKGWDEDRKILSQ